MKALRPWLGSILAVAIIAGVALAANYDARLLTQWMKGGVWLIGKNDPALTTAANKLTGSHAGTTTYDFGTLSNVVGGFPTCQESWAITSTGSQLGDQCLAGSNLGVDGGAVLLTEATLGCAVSAADVTKVKLCVHFTDGGTYDLHDAGFFTRTLSNQAQ